MEAITLLGSPFEMSLRILLMLNETRGVELDDQQICAIDFIAVYGADFGLLDKNLHGDGNYRYGEYPARREIVSQAIKSLILDGYVKLIAGKNGFTYILSDTGRKLSDSFTSLYAGDYSLAVDMVIEKYGTKSATAMLKAIKQKTINSMQEDSSNG